MACDTCGSEESFITFDPFLLDTTGKEKSIEICATCMKKLCTKRFKLYKK